VAILAGTDGFSASVGSAETAVNATVAELQKKT
jgi:hypothetical protein